MVCDFFDQVKCVFWEMMNIRQREYGKTNHCGTSNMQEYATTYFLL